MRYLHAIGVVWPDVRPDNVVINSVSDAVVVDFGGAFAPSYIPTELLDTTQCGLLGLSHKETIMSPDAYEASESIEHAEMMLGNINRKSAEQMFVRIFTHDVEETRESNGKPSLLEFDTLQKLALQFSSQIPEDTFTPSQLQGFFQLHLNNATEAFVNIARWVERELSRSLLDDISIVSEGKTP
ncbi:hypothetical protein F5B21DRAFT_507455 [Xylaria acuta]|nr:hypothetical protein F5B21DRAFT_507455 [Xylaria acuta]